MSRKSTAATDRPRPAVQLPPGREPLASAWRGGVRNPLTLLLLAAIRLYQLTVSPLLGPVCRFYPSCSHYGFEAIRVHGAVRGTGYTVYRLVRCHPWNPGGIDPVPPPRGRRASRSPQPPEQGAAAADSRSTGVDHVRAAEAHDRARPAPDRTAPDLTSLELTSLDLNREPDHS